MKKYYVLGLFMSLAAFACTKVTVESPVPWVPVTDLSKYHMKILPAVPNGREKVSLVVSEDCQYNLLTGVTRNGNIIDVEKHFNSMMMAPCVLRSDTISLGMLPEGLYQVRYKLVDQSTATKNPYAIAITFDLNVAK